MSRRHLINSSDVFVIKGFTVCSTHFSVHNLYIFVITIQFLLCLLRTRTGKCFLLLYTNLRFCKQIRLLCQKFGCWGHRFGRDAIEIFHYATDLTAVPQIWPLCHRYGRCATDMAAVTQIWPSYHRYGGPATVWLLCHIFGHCATDLAAVPQISTWLSICQYQLSETGVMHGADSCMGQTPPKVLTI